VLLANGVDITPSTIERLGVLTANAARFADHLVASIDAIPEDELFAATEIARVQAAL
jgi:hypothetical protein